MRKEVKKYILTIIQSIGARVYIHFESLFSWKSNKVRSVEYLHGYLKRYHVISSGRYIFTNPMDYSYPLSPHLSPISTSFAYVA